MITFKQYNFLLKNINPNDNITLTKSQKIYYNLPDIGKQRINYKPIGLWYAKGTEWLKWLKSEQPIWFKDYNNAFNISINYNKILHLKSFGNLISFTKHYGVPYKSLAGYESAATRRMENKLKYYNIDWQRVSIDYHGIEISPYIYEARFKLSWYYTWDIASGCIWSRDAIVKSNKVKV